MAKKKKVKKVAPLSGSYRVCIPESQEEKFIYCCPAMDSKHSNIYLYHNEIINIIGIQARDSEGDPVTYHITNSYGEEYYLGAGYAEFLEQVLIDYKRRR